MGIIEFFVLVLFVICLAGLVVWIAGKLSPDHPKLFDNVIWVVSGIIIFTALFYAMGLGKYDPPIPRIR